ncbi:dTDP-glucose 4,6-dehydratase [Saccharibacillus sacchari]|uniref:dTDP-glucose 4,6-dehydratase n=1 Tax=Saccharibacillus sacchari TaxID=456493 RepID=UPI0004AEB396|nr:dTDP-glucose 4,6-dehydratase [Saccharibacillus sacchari]
MKLLVTGGAGFIGSNFIHYMLHHFPHYTVINLDNLTYAGNLMNLYPVQDYSNYRFVKADICDEQTVQRLFADGIDIVVHFAAESHVDRSIKQPEIFVQTNVVGTQVLLEAARMHGVKKFIQVSTDEVYGSLGPEGLFTEESPLAPNSPYSASKASADLMVRAYHETFGLPVNITRCSNNYGPYQFPEKLIPFMIAQALKNQPFPVYGDGLHIRDWLHVEDHCQALSLVIHQGKDGEIYNIGGQSERTSLEVVEKIASKMNRPASSIRYVADRPGHDRRYGIDASKIRNTLGWQPEYSFEKGLDATVDWYLNHIEWLESTRSTESGRFFAEHYGNL